MLIYEINFSLLTLFSLLIYIFCRRGLKGRAPEKDENEDSQLYLLLLLLLLFAIKARNVNKICWTWGDYDVASVDWRHCGSGPASLYSCSLFRSGFLNYFVFYRRFLTKCIRAINHACRWHPTRSRQSWASFTVLQPDGPGALSTSRWVSWHVNSVVSGPPKANELVT